MYHAVFTRGADEIDYKEMRFHPACVLLHIGHDRQSGILMHMYCKIKCNIEFTCVFTSERG